MFRCGPWIPDLSYTFNPKECCILSNAFSVSKEMFVWFFFVWVCLYKDYVNNFYILNQPCIPEMKPTWSQWMVVLMCSWIRFARILLSIFCIDIHKWDWSEVLFYGWVLVWFRYQSNCGCIELGSVPSVSILIHEESRWIQENWNHIFFVSLVKFSTKSIWPRVSISFCLMGLFR